LYKEKLEFIGTWGLLRESLNLSLDAKPVLVYIPGQVLICEIKYPNVFYRGYIKIHNFCKLLM
jgi:hypothetical protein